MLQTDDTRPPIDALVVEDDPIINLHLVDALESAGFRVKEFFGAEAALLELQRREPVRLLVTDLKFHDSVDGLALAWKAREFHPAIGLIIATGSTMDEIGPLPAGAVYLGKPFGQAQIHAALSEAMA